MKVFLVMDVTKVVKWYICKLSCTLLDMFVWMLTFIIVVWIEVP